MENAGQSKLQTRWKNQRPRLLWELLDTDLCKVLRNLADPFAIAVALAAWTVRGLFDR